jgi:hypothetical protein
MCRALRALAARGRAPAGAGRPVCAPRGRGAPARGPRRLSLSAPGAGGGPAHEAVWQAIWGHLRRRAAMVGSRRLEEQNIRITMGQGAVFTTIGKFGALAVISSPIVMWISAYMWAYLFRIDICKDRVSASKCVCVCVCARARCACVAMPMCVYVSACLHT